VDRNCQKSPLGPADFGIRYGDAAIPLLPAFGPFVCLHYLRVTYQCITVPYNWLACRLCASDDVTRSRSPGTAAELPRLTHCHRHMIIVVRNCRVHCRVQQTDKQTTLRLLRKMQPSVFAVGVLSTSHCLTNGVGKNKIHVMSSKVMRQPVALINQRCCFFAAD